MTPVFGSSFNVNHFREPLLSPENHLWYESNFLWKAMITLHEHEDLILMLNLEGMFSDEVKNTG